MRAKALTVLLMASTAVSLAGCKRSATGQVVAVVNGEEVSLSELNGELQNAPQGGNKDAIRAAALQGLINRKLLVQQARDRGIDKDPDFLQQQRRGTDELMIAMLGKQVTRNVPVPSQTEIDQFIGQHPEMFAQRAIYQLDQIIFAAPQNREQLRALEPDHDLASVAASLDKMGIKYARQRGTLDTAVAPPPLVKQINSLPANEPFVLGTNGRVVVSAIAGRTVQPLDPDSARKLATDAIRSNAINAIAQKQLKQARDSAKIDYQPGFAPPPGTPGIGGGAGAAK